ncbi:MAG TPA: serine/threonine-protein kinase [Mycobacterium sp.]|nr:serine/threonine-protein kinase [Mycobacterium sp.]
MSTGLAHVACAQGSELTRWCRQISIASCGGLLAPVSSDADHDTCIACLERDGPLTPPQAVRVIEQLAAAINVAHTHGLVHRDIKPSNALMTGDEFVYLIDFGTAHDASATKLTQAGSVIGTFAYVAPECLLTGTADARTDVYALTCVLHECLTGVQLYPGHSREQQIAGPLRLDPPKPTSLNPDIPAGFDDVIPGGMAKSGRSATKPPPSWRPPPATPSPPRPPTAPPLPSPTPRRPSQARDPGRACDPSRAHPHRNPSRRRRHHDTRARRPANHAARPRRASHPSAGCADTRRDRRVAGLAGEGSVPLSPRVRRPRTRIVAVAAAILVIVAASITGYLLTRSSTGSPSQSSESWSSSSRQIVMPFPGLNGLYAVAVDGAGDVYVADSQNHRVLELAAGASTQTELPFTGLSFLNGVAVDGAGDVYVTDYGKNRVLKTAAGLRFLVVPQLVPFLADTVYRCTAKCFERAVIGEPGCNLSVFSRSRCARHSWRPWRC